MFSEKWSLKGKDTFSNDFYPLEGEYDDELAAKIAAVKRLIHLEETQPTKTSGGQGWYGIQDRVYVVRPDGTSYRFTDISFKQE